MVHCSLVTAAGAAVLLAACNASALDLYVSTSGSDANQGTKTNPFASLEGARDVIRTLKAAGGLPSNGVTVWIEPGTYPRTSTFELIASDSGGDGAPIVYRAAEGGTVRLLGGVVLRDHKPVSDAAILSRLQPTARRHVLQVDLRALGINDFGHMQSRGFGRPIAPAALELFYDGQPLTLARWPNEGQWDSIAGFPAAGGQGDEHGGRIGDLKRGFYYSGDRPETWQESEDIWVHGYWSWDWANSYERVEALDPEQHWIKTAAPHGMYGFRTGQRFYFLNILEELDEPGEWFLDRQTGLLYFWPPTATVDRPKNLPIAHNSGPQSGLVTPPGEFLLSQLETPLISLRDTSQVAIRGLVLEATRGHGITINGGSGNTVAGCALRAIGNYGIWIEGGHRHRVVSCDIENTGDGGVHLSGGDRRTLMAGDHSVENCHFQKQGRWSKCYVPAVLVNGVGHRVAHNLIHDHPHCAILFNGNEHQIEFNDIHHVALETGDVGAIYTGRDWTYRGNRIRYNFIHETGGVGMGSMGVYMDDCVSGTEIFGNIFYKVTRAAFLGGGRDHRVENNIFVDCHPAVDVDGRGLDASPVWHNMVYDYMQQQLNAVPAELYRARYPVLTKVDDWYQTSTNGIPPEGNVIARNICVGGEWLQVRWHAKWNMLNIRDNYSGPDPGFTAPEKMQFRLKPESPAWKTGFQPIPLEQIGLQDDEFRQVGKLQVWRRAAQ